VTLKQFIERYLQPIFTEKGFLFDEDFSAPSKGIFDFTKYAECRPEPGWSKTHEGKCPLHEGITIGRNSFNKGIGIQLRSSVIKEARTKKVGITFLYRLADPDSNKYWPIKTKEQVEEAYQEIKSLLDQYAWDWFTLD
jgi:hypothetical protein